MALVPASLWGQEEPGEQAPSPFLFGPLPIRSLDSLSLLFYHAPAERADTLPAGKWEISTYLVLASSEKGHSGEDFKLTRDGEITRWELRARWGIACDLELALVLPFHYTSSGFLDEFIDDFHDATSLGPSGRPQNRFEDRLSFRGQTILELPENTFGLADMPIVLKYSWLRDDRDPLGIALRAGIELPTGSTSDSFGSGEIDGGFGVVLQKTLGDFSFYLAADASVQQTPRRFRKADVEVEPIIGTASLAGEWRVFDWLGVTMQIDFGMPIIKDGEISKLTRPRVLGTLGATVALGEVVEMKLGFTEDLFYSGSVPDVMFLLGLRIRI